MNHLPYLRELRGRTPLAIERLKVAWMGLSPSDRAQLLWDVLAPPDKILKSKPLWSHHRAKILDLALSDPDPYVRYTGARFVAKYPSSEDDRRRTECIKNDPCELVHYAPAEPSVRALRWSPDRITGFWNLPHLQRLIAIDQGVPPEAMAQLLRIGCRSYAGAVTQEQMLDVVLQFFGPDRYVDKVASEQSLNDEFVDGYASFSLGSSIASLWALIPEVPPPVALALLQELPEYAGFRQGIGAQILGCLDEFQLEALLCRDDISVPELRRKIYRDSQEYTLRAKAIDSPHFQLLDEDIGELIINKNDEPEIARKKMEQLDFLGTWCGGGTLVQLLAIRELIHSAPRSVLGFLGDRDGAVFAERRMRERAERLGSEQLLYEIRQARLFRLAQQLSQVTTELLDGRLAEQHQALSDAIVLDSPWQTYVNLRATCNQDSLELPGLGISGIREPPACDDVHDRDERSELPMILENLNLISREIRMVRSRFNRQLRSDRVLRADSGDSIAVIGTKVDELSLSISKFANGCEASKVAARRMTYMGALALLAILAAVLKLYL